MQPYDIRCGMANRIADAPGVPAKQQEKLMGHAERLRIYQVSGTAVSFDN